MSGSEHARPVWLTESHVAAIWIAYCRLAASAARNVAESGDPEGDDDWAELLLDIKEGYENAPADPTEAVRKAIDDTWGDPRAVLAALGMPE